jgi:hypothetical protein
MAYGDGMKQQTLGQETAEPISPGIPDTASPDASPSPDEIKQALDKEPTIPDEPGEDEEDDQDEDKPEIKEKRHVPRKVEIVITDKDMVGQPLVFTCTGKPFISVSYNGHNYGGSSPCEDEDEIKQAIKWDEETIRNEGDIPIIKDEREASKLGQFYNNKVI